MGSSVPRRLALLAVVASAVACAPAPVPPQASMTTTPTPAPSSVAAPDAESEPCIIEGSGEPLDTIIFHTPPDLALSATRGGPPLLRTQGDFRHKLHGRWTDFGAPGGDGRAHLDLEKQGVYRISGFADVAAVRFRLKNEVAVVADHVFLEADALVRVTGVERAQATVAGDVPFDSPHELATRIGCRDLGYEAVTSKYVDALEGARAHVGKVRLLDAPGGSTRFEADVGLLYVRVLEERDGFSRIEGARHRVRMVGWTPSELVDHAPRGSGYGSGSRSYGMSRPKGRAARVSRATPLLARAAAAPDGPVTMGQLAADAGVVVLAEDAELATISLADGAVTTVGNVVLQVRLADLAPHGP